MSVGDKVHIIKGQIPSGYHCNCEYCLKAIGELRQPDESYYNRLERRQYYNPIESGSKNEDGTKKHSHIAKSPLHIARWAIQRYTKVGDWVLDPTIGGGTTAVEAITQGRSVAGMELEFDGVLKANVQAAMALVDGKDKPEAKIGYGDARNIGRFLKKIDKEFQLIVNNPPYSGDVSMPSPKGKLRGKEHRHLEVKFEYRRDLPNLAFLREGEEYWQSMIQIYGACVEHLVPGGHFVLGIKDMSRKKKPYLLHKEFCDRMVADLGLKFVGTAFLNHYPRTLFLNMCEQVHGFKPPFFQTISVLQKRK